MLTKGVVLPVFLIALAGCDMQTKTETGSSEADPVERYDAREFFESTSYFLTGEFCWSADDGSLLVGSDNSGIFNAYALDLESGRLRPLTRSTTDSIFPRSFFPEDQRFLYVADQGGNELSHLYVMNVGGKVIDLTPGENVRALFAGWSRSNKSFYVMTNERNPQASDLYEYQADDYSRELIFENDGGWVVADGDDDHYLALIKRHSSADSDIYLIDRDAEDSAPRLITAHEGNVSHNVYTFTRDGKIMVYATNEFGEYTQAWNYELATGKKTPLIEARSRFADFQRRYPEEAGQKQVGLKLQAIRQEEATRDFGVGQYYERSRHFRAAVFCYNNVVEDWPDTVAAARATALLVVGLAVTHLVSNIFYATDRESALLGAGGRQVIQWIGTADAFAKTLPPTSGR